VAKVRLARSQSITVNGRVLLGTRDFDIDVDSDSVDVTPWDSDYRGEMPLTEMTTITLQVYHQEEVGLFMAAWNQFPPLPLTVSVVGASANFVIQKLKISGQFNGLVVYEVVLKLWPF